MVGAARLTLQELSRTTSAFVLSLLAGNLYSLVSAVHEFDFSIDFFSLHELRSLNYVSGVAGECGPYAFPYLSTHVVISRSLDFAVDCVFLFM